MLRIRRAVAASFNTTVNFAATMIAAQTQIDSNDKIAALEAAKVHYDALSPSEQVIFHRSLLQVEAAKKASHVPQFVKAGGAEVNRDEISIDDEDDGNDDAKKGPVEKVVPDAVFGGISSQSTLGAKARFQAKQ